MAEFKIETERLNLHSWREVEVENARGGMQSSQASEGECFWAIKLREGGAFFGSCDSVCDLPVTQIAGKIEIGRGLIHSAAALTDGL
jgi:hypothetical protein